MIVIVAAKITEDVPIFFYLSMQIF